MALSSKIIFLVGLLGVLGLPEDAIGQAFDEQPHILITVGHTSSADWDAGLDKYVATCDYRSLNGVMPMKGEACDGSPRLSLTVEDLKSLKYITQASDHTEFVRRVYERFPKVLFISSPNARFDYGRSPEKQSAQDVDFRSVLPSGVSVRDYDILAERAAALLQSGSSGVYSSDQIAARILGPYANDVTLGGTLENVERVLPEYSLIFFYKNPSRLLLIHELIHFLIDRAEERSIVNPERIVELGQNDGKRSFLYYLFFRDPNFSENEMDPKLLAYWDLIYLQYALENKGSTTPEEMEVAYFLSKYGRQLNLPSYSVVAQQRDFWSYAEEYRRVIDETYGNPIRGIAPESIIEPVNSNASFELDGRVIPGFFRDYWKKILTIAKAYPKDLLGDENNVNRRNPRTIIDHFVVDVGPRSSTTAQR